MSVSKILIAAIPDPSKFGILLHEGEGNLATPLSSRSFHTLTDLILNREIAIPVNITPCFAHSESLEKL